MHQRSSRCRRPVPRTSAADVAAIRQCQNSGCHNKDKIMMWGEGEDNGMSDSFNQIGHWFHPPPPPPMLDIAGGCTVDCTGDSCRCLGGCWRRLLQAARGVAGGSTGGCRGLLEVAGGRAIVDPAPGAMPPSDIPIFKKTMCCGRVRPLYREVLASLWDDLLPSPTSRRSGQTTSHFRGGGGAGRGPGATSANTRHSKQKSRCSLE